MGAALRRQRQTLSEFEASLVYIVSSRTFQDSQGYAEKPCLGKKMRFILVCVGVLPVCMSVQNVPYL